jgi:hypothetical protein
MDSAELGLADKQAGGSHKKRVETWFCLAEDVYDVYRVHDRWVLLFVELRWFPLTLAPLHFYCTSIAA